MTLSSFANRHVLEDHITGFETRPNANHLSVLRGAAIVSVLAHPSDAQRVFEALDRTGEPSIRNCGPAEWLIVSQSVAPEILLRQLREVTGAFALDQSDGCVLMQMAGPNMRQILAKCVGIDLHRDVFALGASANMAIAQVSGNLARTGEDVFEIIVPRSYAGFVFEEIREMGREFALTAAFAEP
ncbi:sarcosine oxidase subunit gamma [Rhizobium sp. SSA_523]|uniref:sarcosine oxidase subunit gamma n=1 Tax=Rhizobium sp. SSA_523 TaxID=2952477 RepID=UPI0020902C14|nr:sarcosine oxidase subunit gamma family protein [Rhizobium sp. SSA_523]MCO5732075.1 sarcosine oxidase subunit gamma [Rhizobium sp. SSA_523]WKC22588.1 sarcosine oxidase subunit gamma family protein [Rhizobium sp. SSA_523]